MSDVWTLSLFSASYPVWVNFCSSMILHPTKGTCILYYWYLYENLTQASSVRQSSRLKIMHHDWVLSFFVTWYSFSVVVCLWLPWFDHVATITIRCSISLLSWNGMLSVVYNCVDCLFGLHPVICWNQSFQSSIWHG